MPKIADLLAAGRTLSFEFFPPKTDDGVRALHATLDQLAPLGPSFVSVTYGAGGSTKERTRELVLAMNDARPFPAMPHLTCMSHTKAEVLELLDGYAARGIENILALGGDPPASGEAPAGEFTYASELVELVQDSDHFCVGVAAFPELHPRSPSRAEDRRHLAAKLRQADFGISQFFYEVDDYCRMIDELDALGVRTPVLPGVMPPTNAASIRRFAAINGSRTPDALLARIEAAPPADQLQMAVDSAVELCAALLDAGAPGIHLYTLNRAEAAVRICAALRGHPRHLSAT